MKKLLAILISAVMLICSAVPVFAQTTDESTLDKAVYDLDYYTIETGFEYGIFTAPGDTYLDYTDESFSAIKTDLEYVHERCENYFLRDEPITEEEITEWKEKIETDVSNMRVAKSELKFLLELCKKESNENNYFSSSFWDDYQLAVANGDKALNENLSDDEIDGAYWNLRIAFNSLCAYNQLPGDADGNGMVDISDATLISYYLAGLTEFNSSQKTVANVEGKSVIDINCVTDIQLYLALYSDSLTSDSLTKLTDSLYSRDIENNLIFEIARFYPYIIER